MSTSNSEKVSNERAGISSSIGNVPDVHANTSATQTVTLSRDGAAGTVYTIADIYNTLLTQNNMIKQRNGAAILSSSYNMYIHAIRLYGVSGGFISAGWFPHRQNWATSSTTDANNPGGFFFNYCDEEDNVPLNPTVATPGQLTQVYDFGVEGSSRPHLKWEYPKAERLNNPFYLGLGQNNQSSIACIVQSRGFGIESNDNHIIQFDVTVQPNQFILTGGAFGASLNFDQLDKMYRPHPDKEKRIKEAEDADEIRLKKRKIKHMKDLTMPVLDSA